MGKVGLDKFVNVKTQTQPKNFITQPNLPTLENWPNPAGWVGLSQFCLVCCTPLIEDIIRICNWMLRFLKWTKFSYKISCNLRLQPYSIK